MDEGDLDEGHKKKSRKAAELGRRGGLKGGKARAAKLGAAALSASGKKAAAARWGPMATHSGMLPILGMQIPAANLDNGMRVLSQRGFYGVIGGSKPKGQGQDQRADDVPSFLAAANLQPFISDELRATTSTPIVFRFEHVGEDGGKSVHTAHGIDAMRIPDICDVFLKARDAGKLHHTQKEIAKAADLLIRAFARVGIIALVDAATGYERDRQRDELFRVVDAYVDARWRKWTQVFPHAFFKQIHRMQGWPYVEKQSTHPQYVGKLINEYIYARLPPGVLQKLQEVNPVVDGSRRRRHHMHLTETTGVIHLDKQIESVTTLLEVSDDKVMFEELLHRRFPMSGDQLTLMTPRSGAPWAEVIEMRR